MALPINKQFANTLRKNKDHDVSWITRLSSNKTWSIIAFGTMTHAWEVLWFHIAKEVLETLDTNWWLQRWELVFSINNLLGFENFMHEYQNTMHEQTLVNLIGKHRFMDQNMNRLFLQKWWYEQSRAKELVDYYKKISPHLFFDIHSFYGSTFPDEGHLIHLGWSQKRKVSLQWLEADMELMNIDNIITGTSLASLIAKETWAKAIWFEAGNECWWYGLERWMNNVSTLLFNNGMIPKKLHSLFQEKYQYPKSVGIKKYKIINSIIVNDADIFQFNEKYKSIRHEDRIEKWDIIGYEWNKAIIAPTSWYVIYPLPSPKSWNELLFIGDKVS